MPVLIDQILLFRFGIHGEARIRFVIEPMREQFFPIPVKRICINGSHCVRGVIIILPKTLCISATHHFPDGRKALFPAIRNFPLLNIS